MEASVVEPEAPTAEAGYDGEVEATRSTEHLFEWSSYVDVGVGATECEDRRGDCQDPAHFHAWVCLPNAFQIRDIGDKARAAQARKRRALKDAGNPSATPPREASDSYVTLEGGLDMLREDEDTLAEVKENLAGNATEKRLAEIIEGLSKDDRFEHQQQDAEEFRRLGELPEDERDSEEYAQLEASLKEYAEEFGRMVDKRREQERAALDQLSLDKIIDMERARRIRNVADETYLHVYYAWSMFIGARQATTTGHSFKRKFASMAELRDAPPEVVRDLREMLNSLESRTTSRGGAAGNS